MTEFENSLTNLNQEWEQQEKIESNPDTPAPRVKKIPPWFRGGQGAAQSSMLAARQLGLRPSG